MNKLLRNIVAGTLLAGAGVGISAPVAYNIGRSNGQETARVEFDHALQEESAKYLERALDFAGEAGLEARDLVYSDDEYVADEARMALTIDAIRTGNTEFRNWESYGW